MSATDPVKHEIALATEAFHKLRNEYRLGDASGDEAGRIWSYPRSATLPSGLPNRDCGCVEVMIEYDVKGGGFGISSYDHVAFKKLLDRVDYLNAKYEGKHASELSNQLEMEEFNEYYGNNFGDTCAHPSDYHSYHKGMAWDDNPEHIAGAVIAALHLYRELNPSQELASLTSMNESLDASHTNTDPTEVVSNNDDVAVKRNPTKPRY
jgi:hypothetical protein